MRAATGRTNVVLVMIREDRRGQGAPSYFGAIISAKPYRDLKTHFNPGTQEVCLTDTYARYAAYAEYVKGNVTQIFEESPQNWADKDDRQGHQEQGGEDVSSLMIGTVFLSDECRHLPAHSLR